MASRVSGPAFRKGDWICECGKLNFAKRRKCVTCSTSREMGTLMTKNNMKCRKRYKAKAKKIAPVAAPTIYLSLKAWSLIHPYGKTISIPLLLGTWVDTLLESVVPSEGAHIHAQSSKWKFFKINLGTRKITDPAWLDPPTSIMDRLNSIAFACLSAALLEVADYKGC